MISLMELLVYLIDINDNHDDSLCTQVTNSYVVPYN